MGSVRLSQGTAARRDRGAFDPLPRSHPRLPRRSDGRARQDDRPSRLPTWRRPARRRSSTMATRSARRCRSITTTPSAANIRSPSSASTGPRARRTPSSGFSSTILAASRTNCRSGQGRDGMGRGSSAGPWFPDAFIGRMANLQRFCAGEDPRADRLGRGRLDDDGAGRGGLRIKRQASDAAQGASLMAWILVETNDAAYPTVAELATLQMCSSKRNCARPAAVK